MASSAAQPVSKTAKKKAAKALERTASPAPSNISGQPEKNGEDGSESPYIRELQKNIRNVNKKITNASKTDSLLAEHKGKSVDELVAARIINADQKAQILKKPQLQEQLAQLEGQLDQYLKLDKQYRTQAAADKAEWEKRLEKAKADAVAEAKSEFEKTQRANLLLVSQFLRLAASRREEQVDPESDESQAIEGVLLLMYAGDDSAVDAALKLAEGSEDTIMSVPGEQLQTNYRRVKQLTEEYKAAIEGIAAPTEAGEPASTEIGTDPTVAHATTAEIESGEATQINGTSTAAPIHGIDNVQVTDEAANSVAGSNWNSAKDVGASQDSDWVEIPRDPAETDTGLNATPAANANTQSWADDHPEQTQAAAQPPTNPDDGFHQVQRKAPAHGNRGRGRGEWRGGRGRGRGDRGRGGGPRNAGGAPRGGRRNEES